MRGSKLLRSPATVLEAGLAPDSAFCEQPGCVLRIECVMEVLLRLPEVDFQSLCSCIDDFRWFVPSADELGRLEPFVVTNEGRPRSEGELGLAPFALVLYLSPMLESVPRDVVLGVIAHELAHVVCQHSPQREFGGVEAAEDEAWELTRRWGFASEEEAHELWHRDQSR